MFGYASFAQPTFAALGSSNFYVTVSEAFTVADVESVLRTAYGSVVEAIISEVDSEAVVATFIATITENLNAADSSAATASYIVNALNAIQASDTPTAIKIHNSAQTENINLLEAPVGFAWIKINNTEGTQWVLIDNRQ